MIHFQSSLFADCDTEYNKARYVIIGVPYDGTTSYRSGTRAGPRAIRDASYNFESYHPGYAIDFSDIPITDLGDIDPDVMPEGVVSTVEEATRDIITDGKVPVILGGEHSITIGAVRAVKPDCYVVCDAHLDLRSEYRGTVYNHACSTRRVLEEGVREIIIIGARSGTKDQFEFAESNLTLFTADIIRENGILEIIDRVAEITKNKRVYFSIDADVIDCCQTPGVGTPEPFGLMPQEIRRMVGALAPETVAFDYVEVCPIDQGQTATIAAQIVREFIAAHWCGRGA